MITFFVMENGAKVIVVPGAAVWQGGTPSPSLERRMNFAIELIRKGYADWLLLSGGIGENPPSEAEVMLRLAKEARLDEDKIVLEALGRTTWHNAQECSRIIKKNNWADIIIVTDRYHMVRSILSFRSFGIKAIPCPFCKGHSGTKLYHRPVQPLWERRLAATYLSHGVDVAAGRRSTT